MERRRTFLGWLLTGLIICLAAGGVLAAGYVKADGILTVVENDGTVLIDEKGYEVAHSAEILDPEGKRISLRQLKPPSKVDYEYEHTKNGPVIRRIKEIPKVVPQ